MPKTHSQKWRNRIVEYTEVDPADLLANPLNYRIHPKNQQDALAGVISDIGFIDPVIVQQGTDTVIDGHLRVTLALRDNIPTIPVQYVDLTDAEAAEALATIDPLSAMAVHDADKLRDLLDQVSTDDAAVMQMLSDLAEDAGVIDFGATEGLTDPDEVPEPLADPITQPGDLWLLGRHRLLCGDSTKADDVARLMAGESLDLLMTDPPYGIDAPLMTLGKGKKQFHRGDWDGKRIDVSQFVSLADRSCIWGGNYYADLLPVTNDWIAWHKKNDDRSYSEFELAWTNYGRNTRWFAHHWSGEVKQHPTQKPVEVIAWAIDLSPASDTVLDLFGGSGSTLIACEQTGRRCAMMELDPIYCDVIVRRFEAFTGQTATRATDAMAAD